MNRTQYIKYRQLGMIGEVAFYHVIQEGMKIDRQVFNQLFSHFYNSTVNTIKWNFLWAIYDFKFNISILSDKDNKIIKIY